MVEAVLSRTIDLHDDEVDAIDAIKADLASAEAKGDAGAISSLRDRLSAARIKRIGRLSNETWDALEHLVGHKLRR